MNNFKFYYIFCLLVNFFVPQAFGQSGTALTYQINQIIDLKMLPVALKNPSSLTVSLYGDVYVVDTDNHLLVRLDAQGGYVNHTGGFGWKDQQLDAPKDVSTYDGLNIYVADFQNQRIQRYNRNLQFISSLGRSSVNRLNMDSKSTQEIDIGYPVAIAISPLGDMFCINQENNHVIKIGATGNMGMTFGGFESGKGQLNKPFRIRVTKNRVYILDQSHVVMYDYFGNYLNELSHALIKKPNDIVIDRHDRIYITESNPPVILVFNSNGQLVSQIMEYDFKNPVALGIYGNRLYVLDNQLLQIVVFHISESR